MYATIQAALTAINAGAAPTMTNQYVILVYPGTYMMTAAITVPQYVSVVGIADNFPVLLQNNTTDIFECSGYNQFIGLTIFQGTAAGTCAFNAGNNTDVSILRCAMYAPPAGTPQQQFLTATGNSFKRLCIRDSIVNNGATSGYTVALVNTSTAARFCDSWFQECFFDSYSLTNFGGSFNLTNVQDVRVERCTLRGAVTYNTSVRCTKVAGMTGTPQVEVRHCYCAGGVTLFWIRAPL